MTTGTKISLAVFACVVGVLVVYYGMIVPRGGDEQAPVLTDPTQVQDQSAVTEPPAHDSAVEDAAEALAAKDPFADIPDHTQGLLSETLRDATGRAPGEFDVAAATPNPGAVAADDFAPADPAEHGDLTLAPPLNIGSGSTNAEEAGTANAPPQENETPAVNFPSRRSAATESAASDDPHVAANQPIALPGPQARPSNAGPARDHQPQPPATRDYVVQEGDTMTSIADDWFGAQGKWPLIAKANPLVDPMRMQIGQKLKLPPRDAAPEPEPPVVARPSAVTVPPALTAVVERSAGRRTYTVKAGDTLSSIARRFYKDPAQWETVYEANRALIGRDPGALKVGMKLTLPETAARRGG
jgi:nucleoid-associated protein YgaU